MSNVSHLRLVEQDLDNVFSDEQIKTLMRAIIPSDGSPVLESDVLAWLAWAKGIAVEMAIVNLALEGAIAISNWQGDGDFSMRSIRPFRA